MGKKDLSRGFGFEPILNEEDLEATKLDNLLAVPIGNGAGKSVSKTNSFLVQAEGALNDVSAINNST